MKTLDTIWHGAAYYPELWPDTMEQDIALMKEAGINMVRIAEFAWSSLEPSEGMYTFDWLDKTFDLCEQNDIAVVLCTPTATPPRWLTARYPEVLRVDIDGKPFSHGSRQHVSHCSQLYRRFSRNITRMLAERYGKRPGLVAWQTDNEFLCHVDGDYSESARRSWHLRLAEKYGTIEELNRRWSTDIWSETYYSFDQIPMKVKTPFACPTGVGGGRHNVSLEKEWYHFTSDSVVAFQKDQVDIIRQFSDAPVTHNHIQHERVAPEDLFRDLDFAATDFYARYDELWRTVWTCDYLRGCKMKADGTTKPFMVLETSPSHNGSTSPGHLTHPDGFLRAEAAFFMGHGANCQAYWLWRQQRSGVEMCHGSVVTAWGTPSVGWKNVQAVSQLLQKMKPVLTAIPPAPAELAVHHIAQSRMHRRAEPLFRQALWPEANNWILDAVVHRPLLELGYWRDVRFTDADVSRYSVVLSPFASVLPESLIDRMVEFVENGGTWVVGPMSGCRTEYGTVPTDAGLGRIDGIAGVKTLFPFGLEDTSGTLRKRPFSLSLYGHALEPQDQTEPLGVYTDGPAKNHVWATRRKLGKGSVYLLTAYAPHDQTNFWKTILGELDLTPFESTWGTSIIPRALPDNSKRAYVVVNWDGNGGSCVLPESGVDVLSGRPVEAGTRQIGPFEVLCVTC